MGILIPIPLVTYPFIRQWQVFCHHCHVQPVWHWAVAMCHQKFFTDIFDDKVKYASMSLTSAKVHHYIFCAVVPRRLCFIKGYTIKHWQEVSTNVTGVQSNLAKVHITNPHIDEWTHLLYAKINQDWATADECKDSSTGMLHTAAQHSHYTLQWALKWHCPKHCCFPWRECRPISNIIMFPWAHTSLYCKWHLSHFCHFTQLNLLPNCQNTTLHNAFQWAAPSKVFIRLGDLDPLLANSSFGPASVPPNSSSIGSVILQGSRPCPTDRTADQHRNYTMSRHQL